QSTSPRSCGFIRALGSTSWTKFFCISPDQRRVGYAVKDGGRTTVIVDGHADREFDEAGALRFSPDSRHVAYLALREGKWLIVADGTEGKPYETIVAGHHSWPCSARTVHDWR